MKRIAMLMAVWLLSLSLLPASAMAKSKQMEADVPVWTEETVRQYALDFIGGREMTKLWGYYDLQIRRYMPLSAFETFLTTLDWMTGEFLELGSYSSFSEPELQLKTHVLHLCMEKQDLDMYFTHKDKENDWEVMALQFVPAEKADRPSGLDMLVTGEASEEPDYTETDITVGTADYPLKGILTVPKDAPVPMPACVLVHDRGALDMNSTMGSTAFFSDMAHALAKMGIASIRYDKRTFTYGEDAGTTAWDEVVEDAILAGQMLKANTDVDASRLVLVGHGLGAMLAPRIVSQSDGVFTAMVLIGGTPKTYAQMLLDECDLNDYTAEEFRTLEEMVVSLPKMKEDAAKALTLFGRNGYYFWDMAQYDSVSLIKKLKVKTYIVQGGSDPVISEDNGWRLYSEEIGDGITYVGFKAFRGLNHLLMNDLSEQGSNPQYTVAATLDTPAGKNIAQWILGLNQASVE